MRVGGLNNRESKEIFFSNRSIGGSRDRSRTGRVDYMK